MCGRYAFFSPAEAVRRVFGVSGVPVLEARYNIAPTQPVPVVREREPGRREVALLHWGLVPSWAKEKAIGNRMINARAETIGEKPAFRRAYRDRRCLVLADGWYEWQATGDGKQPWFIRARDRQPLALAGLWERWRDPVGGEELESCAIVTRDAPGRLGEIHHRMPAVIPQQGAAAWRDPAQHDTGSLSDWLEEARADDFEAWPVSRAVNDPRHEGAELVAPVPG